MVPSIAAASVRSEQIRIRRKGTHPPKSVPIDDGGTALFDTEKFDRAAVGKKLKRLKPG